MIRRFLLVVCLALVAAEPAWAHATFQRSTPANGAVLAKAPRTVRVTFDSGVRVGPRNAAVANEGGASVLQGKPRVVDHKTLVIPLQRLGDGDYSVRWSIVSDDGHQEEGVLAFAVGEGRPPPVATLTARGLVTWQRALARTLWYLGILGAIGGTVFAVAVLDPLGIERALMRPQAHVLFFCFLAAFLGSDALIHAAGAGGTRFARIVAVAATVSAVGAAAAALTPVWARLRYVAWAAAGVLFLAPTLSGHSLDEDQPRLIAVVADLVHLGAAGIWFGGLLSLAFVAPAAPDRVRGEIAHRFSSLALLAVMALGLAGLARALTELDSVSQLWSTSYGRTILVKTAIFVPLLGLGWINRSLLLDRFAQLRRSAFVELTLLFGVIIAVSVLVDLKPGTVVAAAGTTAAPGVPAPSPPPLPPRGAFVAAHQLGTNAVALAVKNSQATVTVLGPDNLGVDGLDVRVDNFQTHTCGPGCYRTVATSTPTDVTVDGKSVAFDVPLRLRSGAKLLARATHEYESAHSIVFEERLASAPGNEQTSTFRLVAPDRMAFDIEGGSQGIVIGKRRWDRDSPDAEWQESPQTPLDVPTPYWSKASRNAYYVAPSTISFLDPKLPAWFRLRVDPKTGRPAELHMTAAAHFMVDRYESFDEPVEISPPSR